ncbi:hypothetical protein R52603_03756 [Paraburkholderia saeva]|nr:hypothetical protein R52603_03756 [Paraburkholderia saeva]
MPKALQDAMSRQAQTPHNRSRVSSMTLNTPPWRIGRDLNAHTGGP